ncbi:MAG TPA: TldD/PmbA family protein [Thermoplasmata archaeon]|nr:TldD/PmbA family protein [Thermoplasmata archaeon]
MSAETAFTAFRVGERLKGRVEPPWEVFGEKIQRFELHLAGNRVEMERGPIQLEGYGLRLLRPRGDATGTGFAAATDLSDARIDQRAQDAEATSKFSTFPARRVELPSTAISGPGAKVETVDRPLWERPLETMRGFVHELQTAFEGRAGEVPSFGSLRATLTEATLTNSEGIHHHWRHTFVDFEIAVKSFGGPEGAPPGEYWVNRRARTVSSRGLANDVDAWCTRARDVRSAAPTPSGVKNVVVPPTVLSDVLPAIVGFRLGGAAELRKMAPAPGTAIGNPLVTIHDDGLLPLGLGSAPFDDEGVPQSRKALVEKGVVASTMYDLLHASAFGKSLTGNGRRDSAIFQPWAHFEISPGPSATNLVVASGDGGSEAELMEAAGEGIYLDQLGYAFPDAISGAFGGEVRIAYRIHHGKKGEALRGGTVGGVVFGPPGEPSLLASVKAVGGLSQRSGSLETPSLWVDGLSVAGAE